MVEAQLREEGVHVATEWAVSESVLAKNVLLSVDGAHPYHSLFGRTPPMLIDFERPLGGQVAQPDALQRL